MSYSNINTVGQKPYLPEDAHKSPAAPSSTLAKNVYNPPATPKTAAWHEKAISRLNGIDHRLDALMPNNSIQQRIDTLSHNIKNYFAPLNEFNTWLDDNGEGQWYSKLATFLAKLPLRAARNIIHLLYSIIKTILYAAVHPLKAINDLAKLLVQLAHQLTLPESLSKIGAGIIGANAGHTLVSGNPFSLIAIGIGAACVLGGFTAGAIKAAIMAEKDQRWNAVKDELFQQAKELPESALTGLILGLVTGGIQRSAQEARAARIEKYVKEIKLPTANVTVDSVTGKITIDIPAKSVELQKIIQAHPEIFKEGSYFNSWYDSVRIEVLPSGTTAHAFGTEIMVFDCIEKFSFSHPIPVDLLKDLVPMYSIPAPLPSFVTTGLQPLGTIAGGVSTLAMPTRTVATDFQKIVNSIATAWRKFTSSFPIHISMNIRIG